MNEAVAARDDTQLIEVISVFATRWKHDGHTPERDPDPRLGHLTQFYGLFRDKLPQLVDDAQTIPAEDLRFTPDEETARRIDAISSAELQLFALPSRQVVAALIVFFRSPPLDDKKSVSLAEEILDLCGYAQVTIRKVDLATYIGDYARSKGAYLRSVREDGGEHGTQPVMDADAAMPALPPEQHQIMFVRGFGQHSPPKEDVVNRILYRSDPPYRQEVMKLAHPAGLIQKRGTFAAVTPYVSFIYGHEEFVDYSIFLTTVQAVGTAAQFREIWYDAYQLIRTFRSDIQEQQAGRQQRKDLEILVDTLGNLQLDLSFSVETSADLGLLIPSLRIESFHRELYDVMELPARARTVSRMFDRLESSIQSELTAIDIREYKEQEARRNEDEARRLEQEARRRDWVIAAGFLSAIGVPLGFLIAFFGINAKQVRGSRSIFDLHYLGVYIVAGVIAVVPIAVLMALRLASNARRRAQPPGIGATHILSRPPARTGSSTR
jgi:hypothetical protein